MSASLQSTTDGAVLAAALFSAAFSGVLAVQIFFYHHRYPNDHRLYKFMVAWFWIIDTIQTTSIAVAAWTYLILRYGGQETATKIPMTLVPHVVLSVIRFGLSTVVIIELFMADSIVNFSEDYKPLVDAGFSLAAIADIYIVCVLCYFLKDSRRDATLGTKRMLDTLVIVTINNGALTSSVPSVVTLSCN
ncbi:hypothetical protein F5888DRAFT_340497 [Russula emetica]|nr:hypothetical protein F5888DRAFT_340497 [Russula emetica]